MTKDVCAQGCFTFESFFIEDNRVVLWCLSQTEELASETGEEVQAEVVGNEKTQKVGDGGGGETVWMRGVIHLKTKRRIFRFSSPGNK